MNNLAILLGMFFVLAGLGLPIAASLGITSIFVALVIENVRIPIIAQRVFSGIDSFPLLAIPLFILAGKAMNAGGTTDRIVRFSNGIVGHVRGGLAQINVLTSMFFGGISGSAVADTSSIGGILIPSMIKEKYTRGFSSVVTAFSSAVGPIIPPSITMVVYGITTGASIRRLFIAGAVPGILYGLGLMAVVAYTAIKEDFPRAEKLTWLQRLRTVREVIWALFMPVIIVGGVVSGVFTVTESAAIAAVYALFAGVFIYKGIDSVAKLFEVLVSSVVLVSSIMLVIATAQLYSWLLVTNHAPQLLADAILSITRNPYLVLLLINVLLIVIGMFIEANAAIVIFIPIFWPLVQALGIDVVHFGVIVVVNLGLGLVTPPVGLCLQLSNQLAGCNLYDSLREARWFFVVGIVVLLLVTYVPRVMMWLPDLLGL